MTRSFLFPAALALVLAACSAEDPATGELASLMPDGTGHCQSVREDGGTKAYTDLCVLSADVMAGRLVGTPGNALARAYIIDRLEQIGVEPLGEQYEHAFRFQRPVDFRDPDSARETIDAVNIIARIPGEDPSKVMAVTAHYDHVGAGENNEIFNGADDNASGVAGILAVAEHFRDNPPRHDVLIIGFDAEEGGLNGARHFVENRPEAIGEIVLNLNFDMLAYSPDGDIWAAGAYHTPGLLALIETVAENASVTLEAGYDQPDGDPRNDWTLLSDHGPFHMAGVPFIYVGVEDHEHYHQPSDEFETVDPVFFNGVVDLVVDLSERADESLSEIAQMAPRGAG